MKKSLVTFLSIVSVFLVECSSKTNMTGSNAVTSIEGSWVEKEHLPPLSFRTIDKLEPVDASLVKIDFLLVRDNSESMENDGSESALNKVINNIGYFLDKMSKFEDIDYRIAITSTTSQAVWKHHKENGKWRYQDYIRYKYENGVRVVDSTVYNATESINPNNSACIATLYKGGKSSSSNDSEKPSIFYSLKDYQENADQIKKDLQDSLSTQNIEQQNASLALVSEGLLSTLEALNLINKDNAQKVWDRYSDYAQILYNRPLKPVDKEVKSKSSSVTKEDFFNSFDQEKSCERTKDWYRPDAKLVIIFFSDEDNCGFNTKVSESEGYTGTYSSGCIPYNYVTDASNNNYWYRTAYDERNLSSVFGLSTYKESDGVENYTLYYRKHTKENSNLKRYDVSLDPRTSDPFQAMDISKISNLLKDDELLKQTFFDMVREWETNCHNMGKGMYKESTLQTEYTPVSIVGLLRSRYIGSRSNSFSVDLEPMNMVDGNPNPYYGCPKCNEDKTDCTVPEVQRIKDKNEYKQKYDLSDTYINKVPPKERCVVAESHLTDARLGKAMCTYYAGRYKATGSYYNNRIYFPDKDQLTSYDIGMIGRDDSKNVFLEYLKTLKGKESSSWEKGAWNNVRIYGAVNLDLDKFNPTVYVSNTYKEIAEQTGGEVISINQDHKVIYDKIYDNLSKAFLEDKSTDGITERVSSVDLGKLDSNGKFVQIQKVDPAYYKVSGSVIKFSRFKMNPNATHIRISYIVADEAF